jgi:hypothetical protein
LGTPVDQALDFARDVGSRCAAVIIRNGCPPGFALRELRRSLTQG